MTTLHQTLRDANAARQAEWDAAGQISLAFRGNELAGEVGEALEQAVRALLLSVATGRACNIIKKLERENMGLVGSKSTIGELANELADVVICTDLVAMDAGIDLQSAIAAKFNATSEKVGLETRLDLSRTGYPSQQIKAIDPVKNDTPLAHNDRASELRRFMKTIDDALTLSANKLDSAEALITAAEEVILEWDALGCISVENPSGKRVMRKFREALTKAKETE